MTEATRIAALEQAVVEAQVALEAASDAMSKMAAVVQYQSAVTIAHQDMLQLIFQGAYKEEVILTLLEQLKNARSAMEQPIIADAHNLMIEMLRAGYEYMREARKNPRRRGTEEVHNAR